VARLHVYAPHLETRSELPMPGGARVRIVGDVYAAPGGPPPCGVFCRATRAVWLRQDLRPPLGREIALWSLCGLARAMGRDAAEVRAELLAPAPGAAYRALSLAELAAWFAH